MSITQSAIDKDKKIIVIGDVMLDRYLYGSINRISPEAPVMICNIEGEDCVLGGAGNTAYNLYKIGHHPVLFGMIGNDYFGQRLNELLHLTNIEAAKLLVCDGYKTITKTRVISKNQQIIRLDNEKIMKAADNDYNYLLSSIDFYLISASSVIISDYNKGFLFDDFIKKIISRCEDNGVRVFVDSKGEKWDSYKNIFLIKPNLKEFEKICNVKISDFNDIVPLSQKIKKKYNIKNMVVTLGSKGIFAINEENHHVFFDSISKSPVDVSGAGDTVISVLASCTHRGYDLFYSTKIANIAAGIVVNKFGTSALTKEELDRIIHEN